jgi:hypothetical protein
MSNEIVIKAKQMAQAMKKESKTMRQIISALTDEFDISFSNVRKTVYMKDEYDRDIFIISLSK